MITTTEDLATIPHWCTWKWTQDGKKPPLSLDGDYLSPTDPRGWLSYEQVESIEKKGFLLTAEDPFAGFDLDKCRDPETGEIESWAMDIVEALGSYTEITPSGTGLRILGFGKLRDQKNVFQLEDHKVEVYDRNRYFTFTGDVLEDWIIPRDHLTDVQDWIDQNIPYHETLADPPENEDRGSRMGDEEIISKLSSFKNRDKFLRLYQDGDTSEYGGDDSRADMALLVMFAWMTPDKNQIDRLFRTSALIRDKWDRKLGNSTYGRHSILKALRLKKGSYSPGSQKPEEVLDKFQELEEVVFQYQWDNYSQPFFMLSLLANAREKGWGYDERGVLTFCANRDHMRLGNLTDKSIASCRKALSKKTPSNRFKSLLDVTPGNILQATRYRVNYKDCFNQEKIDSTLSTTVSIYSAAFLQCWLEKIAFNPLTYKEKWTLSLLMKHGALHKKELFYRVETVGNRKTMSMDNFNKTLRVLEGKGKKKLKPYIRVDKRGYVNLVKNIEQVLEHSLLTEEKKRLEAQTSNKREAQAVRKQRHIREGTEAFEKYLRTQEISNVS